MYGGFPVVLESCMDDSSKVRGNNHLSASISRRRFKQGHMQKFSNAETCCCN